MSRSPYNFTGSTPTPHKKSEPVVPLRESNYDKALAQNLNDTYYWLAWNTAYLILLDKEEAEEVVNDVFLQLCRVPSQHPELSLEQQVRVVTRSRALDRYKSASFKHCRLWQSLFAKHEDGEEYEVTPERYWISGAEEQFFHHLDIQEKLQIVASVIEKMRSDNQRICFTLYYIENMELSEIANALHLPIKAVYNHVYRSRNHVKKFLFNQGRSEHER